MSTPVPPSIQEEIDFINSYEANPEKAGGGGARRVSMARLRVAVWVCKSEGIPIDMDSLSAVLGPHVNALKMLPEMKLELGLKGFKI